MHIKKKKGSQRTNFRYPYDVDISEAYQETYTDHATGEKHKRFSYGLYQRDAGYIENWCYENLKGDFSGGGTRWWFEKRNDAILFKLKWS